jgi:hypothetical protein
MSGDAHRQCLGLLLRHPRAAVRGRRDDVGLHLAAQVRDVISHDPEAVAAVVVVGQQRAAVTPLVEALKFPQPDQCGQARLVGFPVFTLCALRRVPGVQPGDLAVSRRPLGWIDDAAETAGAVEGGGLISGTASCICHGDQTLVGMVANMLWPRRGL